MNSMFSSVMLESASVVATRDNNSAWRRFFLKKRKKKRIERKLMISRDYIGLSGLCRYRDFIPNSKFSKKQ